MDSDDCAREITQVADISDDNLNGWAYWQFKTYKDLTTSAGDKSEGFYNKDGSIETIKIKALARTYVQSAQGKIIEMKFNSTTAEFSTEIKIDTSINAPTEIHALIGNSTIAWYPNGVEVYFQTQKSYHGVDPQIKTNITGSKVSIIVENKDYNGKSLIINIVPKKAVSQRQFIQ